MPVFKIIPTEGSSSSAQIIAADAAAVFLIVGRLDCREADVLEDEAYSCSIRLGCNGVWSIIHRHEEPETIQALG